MVRTVREKRVLMSKEGALPERHAVGRHRDCKRLPHSAPTGLDVNARGVVVEDDPLRREVVRLDGKRRAARELLVLHRVYALAAPYPHLARLLRAHRHERLVARNKHVLLVVAWRDLDDCLARIAGRHRVDRRLNGRVFLAGADAQHRRGRCTRGKNNAQI